MKLQHILIVCLLTPLLACGGQSTSSDEYTVVRIADGDSLTVADSRGQRHKVRISGIDAPELGQRYSNKSKQQLSRLLDGKAVRLEIIKTDKYDRLVAKVWVQPPDCPRCGKTLDAGMAQLTTGMAWWYEYWSHQQSAEDSARYQSAEQEARARKVGLWRDSNPINPWEWRKTHRRN